MADSRINWPGLYRWSMSYQENAAEGPPAKGLSKEDRDFLQGAIREAMAKQEDPAKVLQQQLEVLEKFNTRDPSCTPRDLLASLSVVQRLVDDYPEMARDFNRLGALKAFLTLLETCSAAAKAAERIHPSPPHDAEEQADAAVAVKVVKVALGILSLVAANNPEVQEALFEQQGLVLLMNLVREAPPDSSLRVKALATVACQLRHHRASEQAFVQAGGLALLVYGMLSSNIKYQEKAASLTRHLLLEDLLPFELVMRAELPNAVCTMLQHAPLKSIQFGEIVTQLTIALLQQHRVNLSRGPALAGLRESLVERRKRLSDALHHLKQQEKQQQQSGDHHTAEAYVSQEALLDEAIALAKFPGMKPSAAEQAAEEERQRRIAGLPPKESHAKMLAM